MTDDFILPFDTQYDEYLRDESRRRGEADSISFPTSEDEVRAICKSLYEATTDITVQGARTGIVAGAVPSSGHILSLTKLASVGEIFDASNGEKRLRVGPGALLSDVREHVAQDSLFFPPDPTETTASIGGMVAANASGAMTFHYGPTRDWITALRVVLADGDVLNLARGEHFAKGRAFSVETESGRIISGDLPSYEMPDVKSAAGYFATDDMDLVDLFIGMEGTLGIITEVELKLIPAPKAVNGLTVFLPGEEAALSFVRAVRGEEVDGLSAPSMRPVAIEYFNADAVDMLRRAKDEYSAFENIPAINPEYHTAVYIEFHGESDEQIEEAVMEVVEIIVELGGSDEDTWFATSEKEMLPLKDFRHAVPESVNMLIDERKRDEPGLTKLGTDMSVPDSELEKVIAMYTRDLKKEGLESVMFGHIGNNHVHVNILPRNMAEYEKGKGLYMNWAREVVAMGGSVSAEHGIGKLKAPFLAMMFSESEIEEMRRVKSLFDPKMLLNSGNLF